MATESLPDLCVISARVRDRRLIRLVSGKTDYDGMEKELVHALEMYYNITYISEEDSSLIKTSSSISSLQHATSFHSGSTRSPGDFLIRGPGHSSGDLLSYSTHYGQLHQFVLNNKSTDRYLLFLFAKDASHIQFENFNKLFSLLKGTKCIVIYFCRKNVRKEFQKNCKLLDKFLQLSILKYSGNDSLTVAIIPDQLLNINQIITHLNSFLQAKCLQNCSSVFQWYPQLKVVTFRKPKNEKILGLTCRHVPAKVVENIDKDSDFITAEVPIITKILPDSPAGRCKSLWVNDRILSIKGHDFPKGGLNFSGKMEKIMLGSTYVQVVVQRAYRVYGPERTTLIAGKRNKFELKFRVKKNLYHKMTCVLLTEFMHKAEMKEYTQKGLELKSIILAINDTPVTNLNLENATNILLNQSHMNEQIKIRYANLAPFIDNINQDLQLVDNKSLPVILYPPGPVQAEPEPTRRKFPIDDGEHYNYLKVFIIGANIHEDVNEVMRRLINLYNPSNKQEQATTDFSPLFYPNSTLLNEFFRLSWKEEKMIYEIDLDEHWHPVDYSSVLKNLVHPEFSENQGSPKSKMNQNVTVEAEKSISPQSNNSFTYSTQFSSDQIKKPNSLPITPSSSTSSLSSLDCALDLIVKCDFDNSEVPQTAITLAAFHNTRDFSCLSPPDIYPFLKQTGLYILVINLEKLVFDMFERELQFYFQILRELHSLPCSEPQAKVFIVGLYDCLSSEHVTTLCQHLDTLFAMFMSHIVLDSKKFETCIFPVKRHPDNMDAIHVLRQTLLQFSRGGVVDHHLDMSAMSAEEGRVLRVPEHFNKFRIYFLLQSAITVLFNDHIGIILKETCVPDHQLEIALKALEQCTPLCCPETLEGLSKEGILLRPSVFLRILKQLEKWSSGEGMDKIPEQRELCKSIKHSCYFPASILVLAIMSSCYRMTNVAQALFKWMEQLHLIFVIGPRVDFQRLIGAKLTPVSHITTKVFVPSIALWNDYIDVDRTTAIFVDAHVFYLDINEPISSRFFYILLSELLNWIHEYSPKFASPKHSDQFYPLLSQPLYQFQFFKGGNVARIFDQQCLQCNLEITNHPNQFQIEFRAKFGATSPTALPFLLNIIYRCGTASLNRMKLSDRGFKLAIGPVCPVSNCPGKTVHCMGKTTELQSATYEFLRHISSYSGNYYNDNQFKNQTPYLPSWGRPGAHIIDISLHFTRTAPLLSHYAQCQDFLITPDSAIYCPCRKHSSLKNWLPCDD